MPKASKKTTKNTEITSSQVPTKYIPRLPTENEKAAILDCIYRKYKDRAFFREKTFIRIRVDLDKANIAVFDKSSATPQKVAFVLWPDKPLYYSELFVGVYIINAEGEADFEIAFQDTEANI
jgi:hypothetical protein